MVNIFSCRSKQFFLSCGLFLSPLFLLAQLPFIVFNHPDAEEVVRKWSEPGYLEALTKEEQFKTEVN